MGGGEGEKVVVRDVCAFLLPVCALGWWSDSATQVSQQGRKGSKAEGRGGNVDMGR